MSDNLSKLFFLLVLLATLPAEYNKAYSQCCCGTAMEIEVPGGDFETSPFPSSGGWIDYTAGEFLGPWTVDNGSVSHHDDGHNNLGAGNPNPSTAHCDLNGFSEGGICQDISGFVIGIEYTLIFYYAIHNAIGSADAIVEIDGGSSLSETWSASNQGQDIWLEGSYTFIATGTAMDLCFHSDGGASCCGMLVDDIQITFNCMGDTELPVLLDFPFDVSYQCLSEVPDAEDILVTDNCLGDFVADLGEVLVSANPCDLILERTWSAEDDCGNYTEYIQSVVVQDTEAPVLLAPPFDLTIGCDEDVADIFYDWIDNYGGGQLIDNCGEDVFSDANYPFFDFGICSDTEVSFTFSDVCGNAIGAVAFFSVVDVVAPVFDVMPADLNIPCGMDPESFITTWLNQDAYSSVSDNCAFSMTNDFNGDFNSSQTVTFKATDQCGSVSSALGEITINSDVVLVELTAFTCDVNQASIEEEFIDNQFCDTLIRTIFTLLPRDTVELSLWICNVADAEPDTLMFTNVFDCDSLVIINKVLVPADTSFNNFITCDALQVGLDTMFLLNSNNCDSLVIVNTILTAGDTTYNELTTCDATLVGLDTLFLLNANDCDSLLIIDTKLTTADTTYISMTTCDLTEVGLDTVVLLNVNSCDSIVVSTASFVSLDTLFNSNATCDASLVGLDTLFLVGASNCDSLVINSFFLVQNDTVMVTNFSCTIDEPEYSDSILPGPVCDTIVIFELLPLESSFTTIEMNTCRLSEVGIFSQSYINEAGCDSLIEISINYVPIDTVFISTETCFVSDVNQDTINVFSLDCDSVYVYTTTLLLGNQFLFQERTCIAAEAGVDTLMLQNEMGCDSLVLTEFIFDPIEFAVSQDFDPCEGDPSGSIDIFDVNGGLGPYQVSLDGMLYSDDLVYDNLGPGVYNVFVQDANGCTSESFQISFEENIPIEVQLPTIALLSEGETQQIQIEFSQDPASFYWSDESLLSCIDCLNPFIGSMQDTELELFYTDQAGCLYIAMISIVITDKWMDQVYIPNVFAPEGDLGNDIFTIFTTDLSLDLERFEIFDRWGNRVHQNSSNNIEDLKWNGISKGEKLMAGVYVYRLILKDENGELIQFYGDVTLLR